MQIPAKTVTNEIKSLFLHLQYNVFRGVHLRITNLTGKGGKMFKSRSVQILKLFIFFCVIAVMICFSADYLILNQ